MTSTAATVTQAHPGASSLTRRSTGPMTALPAWPPLLQGLSTFDGWTTARSRAYDAWSAQVQSTFQLPPAAWPDDMGVEHAMTKSVSDAATVMGHAGTLLGQAVTQGLLSGTDRRTRSAHAGVRLIPIACNDPGKCPDTIWLVEPAHQARLRALGHPAAWLQESKHRGSFSANRGPEADMVGDGYTPEALLWIEHDLAHGRAPGEAHVLSGHCRGWHHTRSGNGMRRTAALQLDTDLARAQALVVRALSQPLARATFLLPAEHVLTWEGPGAPARGVLLDTLGRAIPPDWAVTGPLWATSGPVGFLTPILSVMPTLARLGQAAGGNEALEAARTLCARWLYA